MKIWVRFAVIGALLGIHANAQAQTSDASNSPDAQAASPSSPLPTAKWSDTVEVIIHGPKVVTIHGACRVDLWKVTRGDAVVWILPTLLDAPRDMDWDTTCVKQALVHAKGLLLPGAYTGVKGTPKSLPSGQKLSDVVSPPIYARFKAMAWQFEDDPERFQTMRPGWAAYYLVNQAYNRMGLEHQSYPGNLPGLARGANVPIVHVSFDNGTSASRNTRNDLDPAEGDACMTADLDRVDYAEDRLPRVVEAWKKGDMPTLLANFEDGFDLHCIPASGKPPEAGSNIAIWETAINKALNAGGTNVAAVPINFLLYKNGVLDKLIADGADVAPPKGVIN